MNLALHLKAQVLAYLARTENYEDSASEVAKGGLVLEAEKLCR
jgi:hypothetical protein